ncbi:hypothetical protein PS15m_004710 [Mucor circinelloides]
MVNKLVPSGFCWCLLVSVDVCWSLLMSVGVSLPLLAFDITSIVCFAFAGASTSATFIITTIAMNGAPSSLSACLLATSMFVADAPGTLFARMLVVFVSTLYFACLHCRCFRLFRGWLSKYHNRTKYVLSFSFAR